MGFNLNNMMTKKLPSFKSKTQRKILYLMVDNIQDKQYIISPNLFDDSEEMSWLELWGT